MEKAHAKQAHVPQVTVVVADHLVLFQIPTLDSFVLADAKQIRVSVADFHALNSADVAC
jgi:hypothetical protein